MKLCFRFLEVYLKGRKDCERKKCEIKDCDPSIFRETRKQNCEVLSKNWKTLHLAMLTLACANYISQPENNFFNMKSETIIISDIKLFSKKIVLQMWKKKMRIAVP